MEERIIAEGKLSREHIDEIRRMFNVIDTDGSGEISSEEIGQIMKRLGKGKHFIFFINLI
jgi:Ca2+-binding EF-hand superfamily protein